MYDNHRIQSDRPSDMSAIPITFRASPEFAATVDDFARASGVSRSDYVRVALEEKNARMLAERVRFLSRTLSAGSEQIDNELDGSTGDGLADR
jgi:hypothetical protein